MKSLSLQNQPIYKIYDLFNLDHIKTSITSGMLFPSRSIISLKDKIKRSEFWNLEGEFSAKNQRKAKC